jgi:hypothetical protein
MPQLLIEELKLLDFGNGLIACITLLFILLNVGKEAFLSISQSKLEEIITLF